MVWKHMDQANWKAEGAVVVRKTLKKRKWASAQPEILVSNQRSWLAPNSALGWTQYVIGAFSEKEKTATERVRTWASIFHPSDNQKPFFAFIQLRTCLWTKLELEQSWFMGMTWNLASAQGQGMILSFFFPCPWSEPTSLPLKWIGGSFPKQGRRALQILIVAY